MKRSKPSKEWSQRQKELDNTIARSHQASMNISRRNHYNQQGAAIRYDYNQPASPNRQGFQGPQGQFGYQAAMAHRTPTHGTNSLHFGTNTPGNPGYGFGNPSQQTHFGYQQFQERQAAINDTSNLSHSQQANSYIQVELLQSELVAASQENFSFVTKLDEAQTRAKQAEAEYESLKKQFQRQTGAAQEKEQVCSNLAVVNDKLKAKNVDLEKSVKLEKEHSKVLMEAKESQITALKAELELLKNANKNQDEELVRLRSEVDAERMRHNNEIGEITAQLKSAQESIVSITNDYNDRNAAFENLQQQLETIAAKRDNLVLENSTLKSNNTRYNEFVAGREHDTNEANETIGTLQEQILEQQRQSNEWKLRFMNADDVNKSLNNKIEALREQLSQCESQHISLAIFRNEVDEFKKRIGELNEKRKTLREILQDKTINLETTKKKVDELREQFRQEKGIADDVSFRLIRRKMQIKNPEDVISFLKNALDDLYNITYIRKTEVASWHVDGRKSQEINNRIEEVKKENKMLSEKYEEISRINRPVELKILYTNEKLLKVDRLEKEAVERQEKIQKLQQKYHTLVETNKMLQEKLESHGIKMNEHAEQAGGPFKHAGGRARKRGHFEQAEHDWILSTRKTLPNNINF